MTTEDRAEALGQLLHDAWMNAPEGFYGHGLWTHIAQAALEAGVGDEYHSMAELYEYRMLYNAHATQAWLMEGLSVVKSRFHSDGEPCFGGGWFIVVATLPTGQVSNHYKLENWNLFAVPEVDLPPEYDGHTPQIAAERLRAMVEQ